MCENGSYCDEPAPVTLFRCTNAIGERHGLNYLVYLAIYVYVKALPRVLYEK